RDDPWAVTLAAPRVVGGTTMASVPPHGRTGRKFSLLPRWARDGSDEGRAPHWHRSSCGALLCRFRGSQASSKAARPIAVDDRGFVPVGTPLGRSEAERDAAGGSSADPAGVVVTPEPGGWRRSGGRHPDAHRVGGCQF